MEKFSETFGSKGAIDVFFSSIDSTSDDSGAQSVADKQRENEEIKNEIERLERENEEIRRKLRRNRR